MPCSLVIYPGKASSYMLFAALDSRPILLLNIDLSLRSRSICHSLTLSNSASESSIEPSVSAGEHPQLLAAV
jgi:hypothetical protein